MNQHPLAGRTVTVHPKAPDSRIGLSDGVQYRIEDYWQNLSGRSWMDSTGNPACLIYAMRSAAAGLPFDDEVVYGKVNGMGALVHVTELGAEVTA